MAKRTRKGGKARKSSSRRRAKSSKVIGQAMTVQGVKAHCYRKAVRSGKGKGKSTRVYCRRDKK